MAEDLKLTDIINLVRSDSVSNVNAFEVLRSLCSHLVDPQDELFQEAVLRVIENRQQFIPYGKIVNDLARGIGLFPYLDPAELGTADKIAYELHRPTGMPDSNLVFHRAQALIYFKLLNGENVILSAPTSFGKSLVIDSMLASNRFDNIAIILPTISLIDETRRRLSRFKDIYKVVTHSSQSLRKRNIFVLTQERVSEVIGERSIDFFVIDEFYKLQSNSGDTERSAILNQAFYRLLKKGGQFYLLGPNIHDINNAVFPPEVSYSFVRTDYKTVVTERTKVKIEGRDSAASLLSLCNELTEPTLIYCASPASANKVARLLFESGKFPRYEINMDAVTWLKEEYHPEWYMPKALEFGIGLHHGKIPRAISQYIVRAFNDGNIRFLVCTSTLIEGVNTKAKNVIVYDNKIAKTKLDFFTFNNICGRSGRMLQHFVGKVFMFHEPPAEELPFVDFPLFSQSENVPEYLLMQMDRSDLTDASAERVQTVYSNDFLSVETIKSIPNVDPRALIALAKHLLTNSNSEWPMLNWRSYPTYDQLKRVCNLIWTFFLGDTRQRIGMVSSGNQLAMKINQVRVHQDIKRLIAKDLKSEGTSEEKNESIEGVLDFVKYWVQYNFPKFLVALDKVQREIFERLGLSPGDFGYYAVQTECFHTDPLFVSLDEYGIPIQTCKRIQRLLNKPDTLDDLLQQIKKLPLDSLKVSDFELELLTEASKYF